MAFFNPIPVFVHTLQYHDWSIGIVEIRIEITHGTNYTVKLTYNCSVTPASISPVCVKYICNIPCFPNVVFAAIRMMKITATTTLDECIENIKKLLDTFHHDEMTIKSSIMGELHAESKKTQLLIDAQELLLQQSREIEKLQALNQQLLEKIEQEELTKSLNGMLDASLNEIFVS